LGLTFFSYRSMPFSPSLIGTEFVIILIGRSCATLGLVGLLKLCGYEKNHPSPINWRELLFICYAGLIRGAIAFGLVLRIDRSFAGRDLIVTTCLSLVLFSTILFASTIGLLGACLFPEEKKEEIENEDPQSPAALEDAYDDASSESSHRSGIHHPNDLNAEASNNSESVANDGF